MRLDLCFDVSCGQLVLGPDVDALDPEQVVPATEDPVPYDQRESAGKSSAESTNRRFDDLTSEAKAALWNLARLNRYSSKAGRIGRVKPAVF